MSAPKGVPEPIRALLEREVQRAMQIPDVRSRFHAQSLDPIGNAGVEAQAMITSAAERWQGVIKTSKIKLD